jgi:hypothetical protein
MKMKMMADESVTLWRRAGRAGAALGLAGVLTLLGMFGAPGAAHAQGRGSAAVETCHQLEARFGAELFRAVYKNFGGCVSNYTSNPNSSADAAHGCHFLVDRGMFATHGECVVFFGSL